MPELPEVETTRRGVEPLLVGHHILGVTVRQPRLRRPVPDDLSPKLTAARIEAVRRRAKYLIVDTTAGSLLVHLGMSGSLRVVPRQMPPLKHDHVDILLDHGQVLRYRDPRRFGLMVWAGAAPLEHPLLAALGPEPLEEGFSGEWLARCAAGRRLAVKPFLMDQKTVVGVGNIYASEALFLAGIHPARSAGRVSVERYTRLAEAVKRVLKQAIREGGTTLRDFAGADGQPGYFSQSLQVYGRTGEACPVCDGVVRCRVIGQRASYFCPQCQH